MRSPPQDCFAVFRTTWRRVARRTSGAHHGQHIENKMPSAQQIPTGRTATEPIMPARTYSRRKCAAKESGTTFEYKMAALMYLRALRMSEQFRLGVNADDAGDFDDIVLKYMLDGNEYQLLLQLKHKESENFKLQRAALKAESGPFSLNKYFGSVQSILDSSPRTHLVLFTNGALKEDLVPARDLHPAALAMLSTGGNLGRMFTVDLSDNICDLFRHKEGAASFIDKVIICSGQANVHRLDEIIKQEIIFSCNRIAPENVTIYDTLIPAVGEWWALDGDTEYLTESWDVMQDLTAKDTLLSQIRFADVEVAKLADAIHEHPMLHISYAGVDAQLRSLKVLQALSREGSPRFLLVSAADLQDGAAMNMWAKGWCPVLAVDVTENPEHLKGLIRELVELREKDDQRKLVVVSDKDFTDHLYGSWHRLPDSCTVQQLDAPSRKLVLERSSNVLEKDLSGELLSVFLLLDNKTMSLLADKNGNTPLHIAVDKQNTNVVELLLNLGASTAAADKNGNTALLIAAQRQSPHIVKLLLDHKADTTAADFYGDSPLIIATRMGSSEIVALLLKHGASPGAADKDGNTSLMIATRKRNLEIVKLLLDHDASTKVADVDGNTALLIAVKEGIPETVKLLLERNARTTVADQDGNTPLHCAVRGRSPEIVQLLLEYKARTMATDMDGNTPLLVAVREDDPEIVELLLRHGASTTSTDYEGNTPLLIAAKGRKAKIVGLLLKYGASTAAADKNGHTALQIANREKYLEIVKLLEGN